MDSSSIDSDIPDLLQFLQYPTSPAVELRDSVFNACRSGQTKIFKYNNKALESNSCLLFDTAAATIHEDRSFLAITGLLSNVTERGDQPNSKLHINATLVPRSRAQTPNGHKKRKHPIRVHRSTSKNDHQRTERLFLVVSRGKDELFELNSPRMREENVLRNSLNISPALYDYSARMDGRVYRAKNKKKGKGKVLEEEMGVGNDGTPLSDKGTDCPPNQVKIYGRIGVTKDDKYVMDCEATINDKPIETRIFTRSNSPKRSAAATGNKNRPQSKQNPLDINHFTLIDSKRSTRSQSANEQSLDYHNRINTFAQTGLCEVTIDSEPLNEDSSGSESFRKETQGTQADFNFRIKKALDSCLSDGRNNNNCSCRGQSSTDSNSQHVSYHTNAGSSEDPIVVISVYPKKAVIEKRNLKDFVNINNTLHKNQQPNTSGSPKAARSTLDKSDLRSEKVNRVMKTKTEKNPFSKEHTVMTIKSNNPKSVNKVERDPSPTGHKTKPNKNKNKPLGLLIDKEPTENSRKQDALVKNLKSDPKVKPSPTRVGKAAKENQTSNQANKTKTKSTNTDLKHHESSHQEKGSISQTVHGPKSALRTVLENVFGQPKQDVSNVRVDIDAKNEYYNVFLHRDPRTTDVKAIKENMNGGTKHNFNLNLNTTSTENYATKPYDERKTSDAADFKEERARRRCGCVNGVLTVEEASGVCKNRDRCDLVRALQELGLMICPRDDQKHCRKTSLPRQEPSKHFMGDDCPITNPVERDKQVRRLLGVSVGVDNASPPATMQMAQNTELQQCLRNHSAQCTKNHKMRVFEVVSKKIVRCRCYRCLECSKTATRGVTVATQYEQQGFQTSSLYKQLTSDFSTNMFSKSQFQPFKDKNATFYVDVVKHKPIVLTRTQYAKVKKSIQLQLSKHSRDTKRSFKRTSIVSIGETRRRREYVRFTGTIEKSVQTDNGYLETKKLNKQDNFNSPAAFAYVKQSTSALIAKAYNVNKKRGAMLPPVSPRRALSSVDTQWKNVAFTKTLKVDESDRKIKADFNLWRANDLHSREVNYSLHTIYKSNKGKKRSVTPNLGASLDSLLGDGDTAAHHKHLNKSLKFLLTTPRVEKKKPFLRRLMSCLVMRTKTSHFDLNTDKPPLSVECSDTTYHISTSLAPMEMSSSMYDTSVSFYTDHITLPINNKMKKGFISSVRGFLKKN